MKHDVLEIVRQCSTGDITRDWEFFVTGEVKSAIEKWQKVIKEHLDSYKVEGNMRTIIGDITLSILTEEEIEFIDDTIIYWVFHTVYTLLTVRYWVSSGLNWES